jgi:hypothetical protein
MSLGFRRSSRLLKKKESIHEEHEVARLRAETLRLAGTNNCSIWFRFRRLLFFVNFVEIIVFVSPQVARPELPMLRDSPLAQKP